MRNVIGMAILLFVLSACGSQYDRAVGRLRWLLSLGPIGGSHDYWLTKYNMLGEDETVALFFGYLNDREACTEFAELYMKKYPADSYTCYPAN